MNIILVIFLALSLNKNAAFPKGQVSFSSNTETNAQLSPLAEEQSTADSIEPLKIVIPANITITQGQNNFGENNKYLSELLRHMPVSDDSQEKTSNGDLYQLKKIEPSPADSDKESIRVPLHILSLPESSTFSQDKNVPSTELALFNKGRQEIEESDDHRKVGGFGGGQGGGFGLNAGGGGNGGGGGINGVIDSFPFVISPPPPPPPLRTPTFFIAPPPSSVTVSIPLPAALPPPASSPPPSLLLVAPPPPVSSSSIPVSSSPLQVSPLAWHVHSLHSSDNSLQTSPPAPPSISNGFQLIPLSWNKISTFQQNSPPPPPPPPVAYLPSNLGNFIPVSWHIDGFEVVHPSPPPSPPPLPILKPSHIHHVMPFPWSFMDSHHSNPTHLTDQPKLTWAYKSTPNAYGPEEWHKISPQCNGLNQSPINIVTFNALTKPLNHPLKLSVNDDDGGPIVVEGKLINNGKTIGFNIAEGSASAQLTGGVLSDDVYTLKQFHLHFGCDGQRGSEHTLDGEWFSGEIHFVFKNDKYTNPKIAMQQNDGLAILAFFMQVNPSADPNIAFDRIAESVVHIQSPKQQYPLPGGLSLKNLVPALKEGLNNIRRYVYKGSLPTPPCYESVTWIVFRRPIGILPEKLKKMRGLYGEHFDHLCGNVRPIQKLNGREIFSFAVEPEVSPTKASPKTTKRLLTSLPPTTPVAPTTRIVTTAQIVQTTQASPVILTTSVSPTSEVAPDALPTDQTPPSQEGSEEVITSKPTTAEPQPLSDEPPLVTQEPGSRKKKKLITL
ncbi:uncharacterized protein LOC105845880 isoform X4 [Hydra vulgaris]|uniref:Carbonic anhydrase n=1 Tax=Hydra vulgaris TaxID=6087 RepID=A0ABM4D7H0_HYDVU